MYWIRQSEYNVINKKLMNNKIKVYIWAYKWGNIYKDVNKDFYLVSQVHIFVL
jgi:hypothetical protein